MRLIDADALEKSLGITDMDCERCLWGKNGWCTRGADFVCACTAIEDAPTVGGWIPCSERLPDIKEHHVSEVCLVYCTNGAYAFSELEENIFGQVGWDCERDDEYHEPVGEVIAWMPLPEPYRKHDSIRGIPGFEGTLDQLEDLHV